ncbi:hypothetical protein Kpol_1050p24 [Vanderwaltozyma polyspora DSM 70294]|uniref:Uncharacterized protein n=1 Tax=Vanderwaltozyma polyspora (strain ATCC 22028 / DSM 70294 / BCRC 21397 / CBS 2163 / NBRC 10782 / NRRL Y-8283 / UCD 57-17) TaxID=436907 RepID=A7TES1_VANPO|nr:uncharacterized protein Kpol_1050p24 [Vanderwaltozyma polyspora DSM 70294]EDO19167.1 hypothetical protein Kpol_1050p24 [Vanderwaltozyma polyspora DSM 70294]
MDAYSLKKDNRKKFQDKQKLKNKHSTPSDRKYKAVKKAEEDKAAEELKEKEEVPLPSNSDRYNEDVYLAYDGMNDDVITNQATKTLKKILQERSDKSVYGEPGSEDMLKKEQLTSKDLRSMDIDQLNSLLKKTTVNSNSPSSTIGKDKSVEIEPQEPNFNARDTGKKLQQPSKEKLPSILPNALNEDEGFLDSLI